MSALAEFVLARIADVRAVTQAAIDDLDLDGDGSGTGWATDNGYEHNHLSGPVAAFIRQQSPECVLAECEAKRRIVDEHESSNDPPQPPHCLCDGEAHPCPTLRILALPYADHPDYREEWRP